MEMVVQSLPRSDLLDCLENSLADFNEGWNLRDALKRGMYMDCGKKLGTNSSATVSSYTPTLGCRRRPAPMAMIDRGKKKPGWL